MLEAEKVVVCCQSKIDPPRRSEKARGDTVGFWEDAVCFTKISFRLFFSPRETQGMWNVQLRQQEGDGMLMGVGVGVGGSKKRGQRKGPVSPWAGWCFICAL